MFLRGAYARSIEYSCISFIGAPRHGRMNTHTAHSDAVWHDMPHAPHSAGILCTHAHRIKDTRTQDKARAAHTHAVFLLHARTG